MTRSNRRTSHANRYVTEIRQRLAEALAIAGVALTGAGCTASVPVEATFPTPVVAEMPLSIGVYYSPEFRDYSYEEKLSDGKTWSITIGNSNVHLFNQLFDALFADVAEIESLEAPQTGSQLDALIKPSIDEYAFLLPSESGLDFYSVSIRYAMELYSPEGDLLGSWFVNSFGNSRSRALKGKESLREATLWAMCDASAALATELRDQPQIIELLARAEKGNENDSD